MTTFLNYLLEKRTTTAIDHPMIEHNGAMVHKNNSEGKPIHGTDAGIKAFHDWAGGTELKDEHGRPKVHYHGTHKDFTEFQPNPALGNLIFLSPNKSHAGNFSTAIGANIKPVYVKSSKIYPRTILAHDEHKIGISARKKGYDAIKVKDSPTDVENVAVFHPSQIKSAIGNSGVFDTNKNAIHEDQE